MMQYRILGVAFGIVLMMQAGCADQISDPRSAEPADYRASLRDALQSLRDEADDPLFRLHFESILDVVEAGDRGRRADTENINELWETFEDVSAPEGPRMRAPYLNRSRPLIISWRSPTDGQVSFTWLTLPADWDPGKEYPLYVGLHGLWDVAADRLEFLTYPFLNPGTSFAYEDGYLISPWGRGNQWYQGISEVDIWECMAVVKDLVRVDESRQYLTGHSMGGYGAWHIALRSAETWAALGVHAGALWYGGEAELSAAAADVLRDVPTYFVVGDADGLLSTNQVAYELLREAGNSHLAFVTFPGGHDYRQPDVERMYLWLREFDLDDRLAAPSD